MIYHIWVADDAEAHKLLPSVQGLGEASIARSFGQGQACVVVVTDDPEAGQTLLGLGAVAIEQVVEEGPIVMRLSEDTDDEPEEAAGD